MISLLLEHFYCLCASCLEYSKKNVDIRELGWGGDWGGVVVVRLVGMCVLVFGVSEGERRKKLLVCCFANNC